MLLAEQPTELPVASARKENAVDLDYVLPRELLDVARESNSTLECCDVREHPLGGQVACVIREGCFREAPVREDKALDPRRGDRLGTQELAGERLEVDQRGRILVQVSACLLRIRRGSGDV